MIGAILVFAATPLFDGWWWKKGKKFSPGKKNQKKIIFCQKKDDFDQKWCEESKKIGPNNLRLVLFENIELFQKNV